MSKQVTLMTDAIPYQEFAKLIGKSTGAVRRMIDKGKLPVIDMTDPQSASGRAGEYWVYLPAWNNGLKLAYETGAVLRDISRNTFQKTSTAMHWMVSSITTPAGR
ncbi:TPA: regulatory phage cox family protein [Escherichia coli]|uniref:regulatory phage cox family protein n=2 Tax=Enterobacteriaceae TaxID=543 RepID=UPI000AB9F4CE|nr:regulatory phage cox family protein [Escherichia coli]WFZ58736.1 regulatory phage cox family protein [Escherichia coli]GCO18702.1 regulatory protein Cox [Escherichia coli]